MQHVSCLVIISFILMTRIYDQLVITLGEIRCLSLLGLKGLMCSMCQYDWLKNLCAITFFSQKTLMSLYTITLHVY